MADVERIRKMYPAGTRIQLVHMDDPYAPVEPGICGTVSSVDDIGQIHMKWDSDRSLALVPEVDSFRQIQ